MSISIPVDGGRYRNLRSAVFFQPLERYVSCRSLIKDSNFCSSTHLVFGTILLSCFRAFSTWARSECGLGFILLNYQLKRGDEVRVDSSCQHQLVDLPIINQLFVAII